MLELAPLYGADVRSLAFDPGDPDVAFAGTSAGHVYRSDDGGSSWRDAGDAVPFPGWVVGSLVFDPHRSGRLWVGLWGIWGGGSVAVSDDAGASWALRRDGLPEDDQVYALTAVPGAPGHLLAATRTGVYRTEDFGEIVFNLVESRLLNTQECDRKDDFRNGFNFREAFDKAWRPIPQSRT